MSFRGKETTDMMGAAARLHGDSAGWKTAGEFRKRRPPDAPAQNDLPLRIQATTLFRFLPRSIPRVTIDIGPLLPLKHTGTMTRCRREGRAIP